MAVFFNGRLLTTPTVATRIDDSAMANKNLTVENNLAIIGQSVGGIPQTVIKLGNPQEAAEYFTSGELVDAIKKAFAPSAETNAPQAIYAVRVDPATQSHYVLAQDTVAVSDTVATITSASKQITLGTGPDTPADGEYDGWRVIMTSGGAIGETNLIETFTADGLVCDLRYDWKTDPSPGDTCDMVPAALALESTDYGAHTTRIKVKVAAGTSSGKYISTSFDGEEHIEDNLGAVYFTLHYTGAATSALVTVTTDTITVKAGVLSSEVEIASCDLTVYDTVSKVSDYFDTIADLSAEYTPKYRDYPTAGKFDFVEGVSIKETDPTDITANLQAIVDWFNGLSEPFVTAYRPAAAGVVPDNIAYTFLYGGTSTTPLTTDWQACFDVLQVEDVQCIVPLSSAAAVHAMAVAHCSYMSNAGAMERRCIVGGAIGETAAEVILRAYC
ncbi:MAG: hypothetical protein M0Q94_16400, partial [Candidatus Cloacimonetes bacterium]|nr:hypothetical protein [Candidatus Cloacimonadota bacterium]